MRHTESYDLPTMTSLLHSVKDVKRFHCHIVMDNPPDADFLITYL